MATPQTGPDAEGERDGPVAAHDRLLRVVDEVGDMVIIGCLGRGVVYANAAARALFPHDPVGHRLPDLLPDLLRATAENDIIPVLTRLERWTGDFEVPADASGGPGPLVLALTVTPVVQEGTDEVYFGVVMRDVTAERRHAEVLARQAREDPLTGLPNRLALMEHLAHRRDHGAPDAPVSVCFIDLDHLKVVNDGLGHSAGDRLLRAVADRLTERSAALVARFGGDEFVVVHEGLSPDELATEARELLSAIERVHVFGVSTQVSASVGVATVRRDRLDPEAAIRDADAAMYVAKRSGRARVAHFDDSMRATATRRFVLETALRRALAHEDLELHLQPVIDVASGEVSGYEGLARWDAATPCEFIPVAEESGLILALGRWAMRTALASAAQVRDLGPATHDLRFAVNVSSHQLLDRHFAPMVLETLEEFAVPPGAVVLELTESALIDPRDDVDHALRGLRDAGVSLALDDFGSGYSSLGYLRRYPIDILKLDTGYIQGMLVDPSTRIIAEAIVTMAHRLGLRVVAEGVETAEQLALVRELGIDWAQGYLLGHPATVEDVVADLSAR